LIKANNKEKNRLKNIKKEAKVNKAKRSKKRTKKARSMDKIDRARYLNSEEKDIAEALLMKRAGDIETGAEVNKEGIKKIKKTNKRRGIEFVQVFMNKN